MYLAEIARTDPARSLVEHAVRSRFTRVYRSVVPERRDEPPVGAVLLADLPLGS